MRRIKFQYPTPGINFQRDAGHRHTICVSEGAFSHFATLHIPLALYTGWDRAFAPDEDGKDFLVALPDFLRELSSDETD